MKMLNSILCLLLICSCNFKASNKEKKNTVITNNDTIQMNKEKKSFGKALKLTLQEAMQSYGTPIKQEHFTLKEVALVGIREELCNIYTEKQQKENRFLEELTWTNDSLSNITIWYEKDTSQYKPVYSFIWFLDAEY
ncbi:MAG: hypothetical protein JEZ01_12390 [Labilibaculum sp.]|nr:hypothetical protein [Labilibaculum sp.]MBI9058554.1 hypothetical protein [Labilibaculum sp.]